MIVQACDENRNRQFLHHQPKPLFVVLYFLNHFPAFRNIPDMHHHFLVWEGFNPHAPEYFSIFTRQSVFESLYCLILVTPVPYFSPTAKKTLLKFLIEN